MKRFCLMLVLSVSLAFALPARSVVACPSCREAMANSAKLESEKDNTPAAFNQSIYLMVGMPYLAFSVLGFMIYRGAKKNAEHLARVRGEPDTTTV